MTYRIKTAHQIRVETFMEGAQQDVPNKPTMPPMSVRKLRAALILEEAMETIEALGFEVVVEGLPVFSGNAANYITPGDDCANPSLVEIADGCIDLSVVNVGTLSACGLADDSLLHEVDTNNLKKLREGTLREDGKLIKPEGHKPPDLSLVIARQRIGL